MFIDLHNHTPLCNHASGTPREFALRAYELGCKYFGFSDHGFMNYDLEYRMSKAQIPFYQALINEVRAEFKGKMDILLGYEADYMSDKTLMRDEINHAKCDYLIGSVHFLNTWGFDNPAFIAKYSGMDIDTLYKDYFEALCAMIKSGLFDIVGHIDLIKIFNHRPKRDVRFYAQLAIKLAKSKNMAIELNTAGYRKPCNELYPSDEILELMANEGVKITFGSDAHSTAQIGLNMDKAIAKAREFGFQKACIFKNRQMIELEF